MADYEAHRARLVDCDRRLRAAQRLGAELAALPPPVHCWQNSLLRRLSVRAPGRLAHELHYQGASSMTPTALVTTTYDPAHPLLPPGMSLIHFEALARVWGCTTEEAIRRYPPAGHWRP